MDGGSSSYFTFCSRTRCSQLGISSLIKFLSFLLNKSLFLFLTRPWVQLDSIIFYHSFNHKVTIIIKYLYVHKKLKKKKKKKKRMRILAVFNVYNTNTEYLLEYICFFFFFFNDWIFIQLSKHTSLARWYRRGS